MIVQTALLGYLIGSIPTAGFLGRLWGIDLRKAGSGNPGTKNALSTGGLVLAATVLLVEAGKGYGAVLLGSAMGDDAGAIAAGIGAVAGNVYNVWYKFEGGKGLGISLGVLAGLWPMVLPVVLGVIIAAVIYTRSAGLAALEAMAGLIISAFFWNLVSWSTGGVSTDVGLIIIALAMSTIMFWKHWRDSPLNPASRSESQAPV